jgi:hypothetical protein
MFVRIVQKLRIYDTMFLNNFFFLRWVAVPPCGVFLKIFTELPLTVSHSTGRAIW